MSEVYGPSILEKPLEAWLRGDRDEAVRILRAQMDSQRDSLRIPIRVNAQIKSRIPLREPDEISRRIHSAILGYVHGTAGPLVVTTDEPVGAELARKAA